MTDVGVAREDDLEEIHALARACFEDPWTRDAFESELSRSDARIWLAREGVRSVGFLTSRQTNPQVEILAVGVEPAWRRRGIGAALLRRELEVATRTGARVAHLELRSSNVGARGLYRRMGFVEVGRRPKYYRNEEDALLMSLEPL